MKSFGERSKFSIELGEIDPDSDSLLRIVDVYAAGQLLTTIDNVAYIPTFISSVNDDLEWAMSDPITERGLIPFPELDIIENHKKILELAKYDNKLHLLHRFMDWGPTSDNISVHMFRNDGLAYIPFSFNDENGDREDVVYSVTLPNNELNLILHKALFQMLWDWKNGV